MAVKSMCSRQNMKARKSWYLVRAGAGARARARARNRDRGRG